MLRPGVRWRGVGGFHSAWSEIRYDRRALPFKKSLTRAEARKVYCSHCKVEREVASVFCPGCGAPLRSSAEQGTTITENAGPNPKSDAYPYCDCVAPEKGTRYGWCDACSKEINPERRREMAEARGMSAPAPRRSPDANIASPANGPECTHCGATVAPRARECRQCGILTPERIRQVEEEAEGYADPSLWCRCEWPVQGIPRDWCGTCGVQIHPNKLAELAQAQYSQILMEKVGRYSGAPGFARRVGDGFRRWRYR